MCPLITGLSFNNNNNNKYLCASKLIAHPIWINGCHLHILCTSGERRKRERERGREYNGILDQKVSHSHWLSVTYKMTLFPTLFFYFSPNLILPLATQLERGSESQRLLMCLCWDIACTHRQISGCGFPKSPLLPSVCTNTSVWPIIGYTTFTCNRCELLLLSREREREREEYKK